MDEVTIGVITYIIGAILAVLWPYLNNYLNTGESFDFKKILGNLLGALGGVVVLITVPNFADSLAELATQYDYQYLYILAVAVLGFGSSAIGSFAKKTFSAIRS